MTEPLTLAQRLRDAANELPPFSPATINYREAANALDAQQAEITRLRDANKALEAEVERVRSGNRYFHLEGIARERADAAEAKLAKVEAQDGR